MHEAASQPLPACPPACLCPALPRPPACLPGCQPLSSPTLNTPTHSQDTYAERFYHSEVLHKGAELYRDERSGTAYTVPDGTEVEVFRAAIEELPANDNPELFGLHSNADLTFRRLQVLGLAGFRPF